jgi:hypothetical protein
MKRTVRRSWAITAGTGVMLLGLLVAGGAAYWQALCAVPPLPPAPAMPQPNGYDMALPSALSLRTIPPQLTSPERTTPELARLLQPARPALAQVHAAFRLQWRTPIIDASDVAEGHRSMQAEHAFRECADYFAAESILARRHGDSDAAMEASLDALELGERLSHGGGLMARLNGLTCHSTGITEAQECVEGLPSAAIPEALDRVRRLRKSWTPLSETWEGERINSQWGWTNTFIKTKRIPLHEQWQGLWMIQSAPTAISTLRWMLTPRRAIIDNYDAYYANLAREARKPIRLRLRVPPPEVPYPETSGDDLSKPDGWRFERPSIHLGLLEVALAVRMHRLERGSYPRSLAEIDRRWLAETPRDLWGQPLIYRLRDGQPVIYSLGPDGKDNGGRPLAATTGTAVPPGDVVFGHLVRTPAKPP